MFTKGWGICMYCKSIEKFDRTRTCEKCYRMMKGSGQFYKKKLKILNKRIKENTGK